MLDYLMKNGARDLLEIPIDRLVFGGTLIAGLSISTLNILFGDGTGGLGLLWMPWCWLARVLTGLVVFAQLWTLGYVLKIFYRSEPLSPLLCPTVSIIKPLYGVKPFSRKCIESIFLTEYPADFDISFCLMTKTDVVLPLVRELCAKYPHVKTKIYTNCQRSGVNPKINNMRVACEAATGDVIWMVDDNVEVRPWELQHLVRNLRDPRVGVVHQFPGACDQDNGPGAMMEVFSSCCGMMWIFVVADFIEFEANGIGKSLLLRNAILKEMGGIGAFDWCIAEDYYLINAVKKHGYRPKLASVPCKVIYGDDWTEHDFYRRALRWVTIRRFSIPFVSSEILIHHSTLLPIIVLTAISDHSLPVYSFLALPLYAFISYLFCEVTLSVIKNTRYTASWSRFLVWLRTDMTNLYCFFMCKLCDELTWGGRKYRLVNGGGAEEVVDNVNGATRSRSYSDRSKSE